MPTSRQWGLLFQDAGERAIVFICHSLGGLVVKQALCLAKANDKYSNIKRSTKLLVFMGTPHKGGNGVALGKIAIRIAKISTGRSKNDFMESLSRNSLLNDDRSNYFRHQLEDYLIISFYETIHYKVKGRNIGLVVDKSSATLGLAGSREEMIGLQADHSGLCKYESEEDPVYIQVAKNIKSAMQRIALEKTASDERQNSKYGIRTGNVHWVLQRRGNPLFTGQSELINRIKAALLPASDNSEPTSRAIFVISGLGGVGKSEVAVQFAQTFRTRFWGVFWVDCNREDSIHSGFQQVARALEIYHTDSTLAVSAVKESLAASTSTWLLILDNCDNPDIDYGNYIPSGLRGAVLMTSRLLECERYAGENGRCNLTGLNVTEAAELVLKAADVGTSQWGEKHSIAESIAETLGRHPLAISLGGAYIRDRLCSLEEYCSVFQKQSTQIHPGKYRGLAGYEAVYATFEVSVQYLEQLDDDSKGVALQLLRVAAYMNRQRISEDIFARAWWHRSKLSFDQEYGGDIRQMSVDHLQWSEFLVKKGTVDENLEAFRVARATLCKLSLANFDLDPNTVSLHPLVHLWARQRLTGVERAEGWLAAVAILALSTEESRSRMPYAFELQPHIEACLDHYDDFNWWIGVGPKFSYEILRVLFPCIYLLLGAGSGRTGGWAAVLLKRATPHPLISEESLAHIKILSGDCLMLAGFPEDAVEILEEVASVQIASTADDIWLIARKATLAEAYIQSREFEKAIMLLEDVVEMGCYKAPESKYRTSLECELGIAYLGAGRVWDAMDVLETVTNLITDYFTGEDPHLVKSWVWLACAYLEDGQIDRAAATLEAVVELMEPTLPTDHRDLLNTRLMLSKAYLAEGRIAEATTIAEDVLKTTSVLCRREENPRLLQAQIILGAVYMKCEDKMMAGKKLLEDVVEIHRKWLHPKHLQLLLAQQHLADAYCSLKEFEKALELLESTLSAYKSADRGQHGDCIRCRKRLADVCTILKCEPSDPGLRQDVKEHLTRQAGAANAHQARPSTINRLFSRSKAARHSGQVIPRKWPGASGMVLAHIYTRRQRELMREGYDVSWVPQGNPRYSEAWKFFRLGMDASS